MAFSEYPIHIDQLCIGLFVRSEVPAPGVPALRKGFKIENDQQLNALRQTGLLQLICVLNRSDRLPSPSPAPEDAAAARAAKTGFKTPVSKELLALKRETLESNKARKERFTRCEQQYDTSVARVAQLLRRVSGRSKEAAEEAGGVVNQLVATFLSESDVLVNLMSATPAEDKTHYHALNVTVLSLMLGRALGFDEERMHALGMGALFHDVGKGRIPVSEMVQGKATTLKYAVQKYYEQHPLVGARLAAEMPRFPVEALAIILQHHENMRGDGFPNRLPQEKFLQTARIVAVTDVYDNLCNAAEDSVSLTPHLALKHLFSRRKETLDKSIMNLFIRTLGVYPPGTVVRLSNGLFGMVVSTNPKNSLRPSVLVHHPEIPKKEALVIDMAVEDDLEIAKTLRPDDLDREIYKYLSPGRQVNYYADTAADKG